jgi:hypothetical protein
MAKSTKYFIVFDPMGGLKIVTLPTHLELLVECDSVEDANAKYLEICARRTASGLPTIMVTPLDGIVLFVIALVSLVLARRNLDKRGKEERE